ncbi:hypothetical protein Tco_1433267, partial [Tanacetum coccineum]
YLTVEDFMQGETPLWTQKVQLDLREGKVIQPGNEPGRDRKERTYVSYPKTGPERNTCPRA